MLHDNGSLDRQGVGCEHSPPPGICAYAKRSPGCLIASAILLSLGVLFSLDVGAYTNLYLFDLITAGFASVYWIAIFRR